MNQRKIYGIMSAGGAVGVAAAFMQTTEKITLLKNANSALACDLNSVFSCTNVLNAWQSSVFGFPNSLMCMGLFTIFTTAAVAGLAGGTLPKGFRLGIQAISLFTLGFALWFLWQSTYVINALCIFCLFCFAGLLLVNWGWLRTNAADLPIGSRGRTLLQAGIAKGADTFGWVLLALAVAFAMIIRFA
jgi:uncharacterized membrane protein